MITPIPNKTALGLVEYSKQMVGLPYWCGCYGQTANAELLKRKRAQYPKRYTAKDYESQFGKKVHDCCGLIKGYMWTAEPYFSNEPKYNGDQDCNAQSFYDRSTVKGRIKTFDYREGLLVYNSTKGHVGVYSKGYVYEAKGHSYGVVKSIFAESKWYYWSECPYISYNAPTPRPEDTKMDTIRFGSQGKIVKTWQTIVDRKPDGDFGKKTLESTVEFQKKVFPNQPKEWDGIVGDKTWRKGLESLNS